MGPRRPPDDPVAAADSGMNTTPMIDIVFQLIVFLMVANDMSRREVEDLDLPRAVHAMDECGSREGSQLIVNLLPDDGSGAPLLRVRGREVDLAALPGLLRPEADRFREPDGATALRVLVRADRASRWEEVRQVMQACAATGVGVRRIQFTTRGPRNDEAREGGGR
ncbi:MAG TPA: biopolymer transporter ExbD [Planctomycetota bacterium]|nr:biopolymer transporter ExbD [Planctomycetota bacterium]